MQAHLLLHKKVGYRTFKNLLLNKLKFSCLHMIVHIEAIYLLTFIEELSLEIIPYFSLVTCSCTHAVAFSLDLTEPLCVALP